MPWGSELGPARPQLLKEISFNECAMDQRSGGEAIAKKPEKDGFL